MTDLELPSLQIGRYFELLKRRRWQLVPVGLLGLVIGLCVAWMIPRYYEASTKVQLYPPLLAEGVRKAREDPFLQEVRKARYTIKNFRLVRQAILDLGWEDYYAIKDDWSKGSSFVWSVVDRVNVVDLDPSRDRSSALLEIFFRDQDPIRAAELANKLRDSYLEGERKSVVQNLKRQLAVLQDTADKRSQAYKRTLEEIRRFSKDTKLHPEDVDLEGKRLVSQKAKERRDLAAKVREIEGTIAGLEEKVARSKKRLSTMQPLRAKTNVQNDPAFQRILKLQQTITTYSSLLSAWRPTHPRYPALKNQVDAAKKELEAELDRLKKQGVTMEPNPLYVATQRQLTGFEDQLEDAQGQLKRERAALREVESLMAGLPAAQERWAALVRDREAARKALDKAEEEVSAQQSETLKYETSSGSIVKMISLATPPPAPTYPNRTLITVIGCVIGILAAISLIFLLDILQPTWKTFDEVARGLGDLPALGAVSFLELPEEIAAGKKRRMRLAVYGAVIFAMLGTVIAVFYLEPLRLPEGVRNFLENVLPASK